MTTSSLLTGAVLPTAEERTGNFHGSAVKPLDPLTGLPFAYNGVSGQIDPARLDRTAQNILKIFVPSSSNLLGGFLANGQHQANIPNVYNTDEYLGKIDHQLTSSQRLTMMYYYTNGFNNANGGANVPYTDVDYSWTQQNAVVSHVWTLTPSLINQAWVTYTRNFGGRNLTPSGSLGALGSSFVLQGTPALPLINVTGYFNLAQPNWGPIAGTDFYSVRDVVSLNKGHHAMTFGSEVSLDKGFELTNLENYGAFIFSGVKTRAATNNPFGLNPSVYPGNAFADFLLGLPVSMEQDTASLLYTNTWNTGIFFQDNYRILPNLTLNLGIRYDLQTPPTDPRNRGMAFTPGFQSAIVPSAPIGLQFIGDKGITRGIVPLPKNHISPRVGLAWDPYGNGKTSFRAAAGLFFGGITGQEWDLLQATQPFIIRQQFNNIASLTNVYGNFPGGVSPFPYNYSPSDPRFLTPSTVYVSDLNFRWPYSYQLSASVQQQFAYGLTLEIAYVGALNHNLLSIRDRNYPIFSPGVTATTVDQRRPFDPGLLSAINTNYSDQTAAYHALQVSVTRRASRSLTLHSFYVWSHNFSSSSINGSQGGTAQNTSIIREDRGRDDYDLRNMFSFSAVWDVSYYHGRQSFLKQVLNGWQISPIVTLQSGLPITIGAGIDFNADGQATDRADLTGVNPVLGGKRGRAAERVSWFNKAAFCNYNPTPATGSPCLGIGPYGEDGSSPRNYIDGPGYRDVDLGLFRTIHLVRSAGIQFRAEATNAFNLVNLGTPNTTFTSSNFGKITSGQTMRQIQLEARLTF